jgi:hypothetical protein
MVEEATKRLFSNSPENEILKSHWGFAVDSLHLWCTDGDVETWRHVRTVPIVSAALAAVPESQ